MSGDSFDWRISNGRIVGASTEGFKRRRSCLYNVRLNMKGAVIVG